MTPSKTTNKFKRIDFSDSVFKNLRFRYEGFGCYLKSEVLEKYDLTTEWLSSTLQVSEKFTGMVLSNKVKIDEAMAIGLAKYFNTDYGYWMKLQERMNQTKTI